MWNEHRDLGWNFGVLHQKLKWKLEEEWDGISEFRIRISGGISEIELWSGCRVLGWGFRVLHWKLEWISGEEMGLNFGISELNLEKNYVSGFWSKWAELGVSGRCSCRVICGVFGQN